MVRLLILAASLAQGLNSVGPADCQELIAGKSIIVGVSRGKSACVRFVLPPGEIAQIVADQPGDIALHLKGPENAVFTDGFEFGQETITIDIAGQYSLDLDIVDVRPEITFLNIPMWRKAAPLQVSDWKAAESLASASKLSGKADDIQASLKRWQDLGEPSSIARTWLKLGDAVRSNDLVQARDAYEHALDICRSSVNLRCSAEAANNSSYASRQLGDFGQAFTRLDEATRGWEKLSDRVNLGKALSNLGLLFWQGGAFQQAISADDRARTLLRNQDMLGDAIVLNNLGLCYLSLAQYYQAEIYFRKAISAESKLKGARAKLELVRARQNLGRSLMLEGHLQPARDVLEGVLTEAAGGKDKITHAFILNNLGQTLLRLGLTSEAESRLQQALTVHQSIGDKRGEASAL